MSGVTESRQTRHHSFAQDHNGGTRACAAEEELVETRSWRWNASMSDLSLGCKTENDCRHMKG